MPRRRTRRPRAPGTRTTSRRRRRRRPRRYLAAERARARAKAASGATRRRWRRWSGAVDAGGRGDGDDGSDSEEGSFDASISRSSLTSSPSLDEGERSPPAPYTAGNAAGTPPAKLSLHLPTRAAARGWIPAPPRAAASRPP